MPEFTIELSDKAAAKLQAEVNRANAANGASLDLLAWMELHLKEIAIAGDMASAVERLRKEAEDEASNSLALAARSERERLLQEL
ncbi:MAG: hypothetical protein WD379_06110 [Dehalococcoidia bacterium]